MSAVLPFTKHSIGVIHGILMKDDSISDQLKNVVPATVRSV